MHRTSITLKDDTFSSGKSKAKARGFGDSFSAYVAFLIERDRKLGSTSRPGKAKKAGKR